MDSSLGIVLVVHKLNPQLPSSKYNKSRRTYFRRDERTLNCPIVHESHPKVPESHPNDHEMHPYVVEFAQIVPPQLELIHSKVGFVSDTSCIVDAMNLKR